MPPSSLYWIQKSASSNSNAAGNRRSAASPAERLPPACAARTFVNRPAPMVPAPKAIVLPKKERRLIYLFRAFFGEREWSLPTPFSELIVAFMYLESQRFAFSVTMENVTGSLHCKDPCVRRELLP